MARPVKPVEERRTFKETIYLNQSEHDQLIQQADTEKIDKSRLIVKALNSYLNKERDHDEN